MLKLNINHYGIQRSGTNLLRRYITQLCEKNNIKINVCERWKHGYLNLNESKVDKTENIYTIAIIRDLYSWLEAFYRYWKIRDRNFVDFIDYLRGEYSIPEWENHYPFKQRRNVIFHYFELNTHYVNNCEIFRYEDLVLDWKNEAKRMANIFQFKNPRIDEINVKVDPYGENSKIDKKETIANKKYMNKYTKEDISFVEEAIEKYDKENIYNKLYSLD